MIDDLKIYLCAHKRLENYIPSGEYYTLLSQTKNIINYPDIIYLDEDEFTKTHSVCYGEGCGMRYLWKHQDILPKYVGFGHYRRYFLEFLNKEYLIPEYVDKYGAIISTAFDHKKYSLENSGNIYAFNGSDLYWDHYKDDIDTFIYAIRTEIPEYWNVFKNDMFFDRYQYGYNCFIMNKENFIEMCNMCFKVLEKFDELTCYTDNDKVMNKMMINANNNNPFRFTVLWQARLQGFLLERLTELYYRKKFGIENCYKSELGYK